MKKCKLCGGNCDNIGGGKYQCDCCGNIFSEDDFASAVKKSAVTPLSDNGASVFENNISGVLEITWSDSQYTHSGSGFLINADGYCITNTHVVTSEDGKSCGTVSVKLNGENLTAQVITLGDDKHGEGNGVDLAIIKLSRVPVGAKALEFENFENVRIGEQVYVIGNSLGYGTCITSGIVSDKSRNVNGKILLMTDCAVNGGNSGGPIFNDKGRVIGAIVSGITNAEGMNFAIPSSTIREFLGNKNITTPYAGAFTLPSPRYTKCPKCDGVAIIYPTMRQCQKCGYRWY